MSNMSNTEIALARQIIENTDTHVFLTGKAGTGKTTFLRRLVAESTKRLVVLAPTGIAAINAGGVTIHSFLQIPFSPYIPGVNYSREQFRVSERKKRLIRSLDLIVIDEISMVRADLLDNMDAVLRRYRDRHRPFGGVQLLMIGDLQQLSPVAKEEEWALLSNHYNSLYFFASHALQQTEFVTIELKTVYRQSDERFLALLNAVRTNTLDSDSIAALNSRYLPHFVPPADKAYVRLVTHNYQADRINQERLKALTTPEFSFTAVVEGNFPASSYPTAETLLLKVGAQVMFVKNDSSIEHRYFNGMLGEVASMTQQSIVVKAHDSGDLIEVEREKWQNTRYALNERTKEIEEVVEGSFEQYPLRTAWSITIHKSQGLTFDYAIINVSGSFAHGQAYVALSRCKTLEGMVLSAPISGSNVIEDATVLHFTQGIEQQHPTSEKVEQMERNYLLHRVSDLFSFSALQQEVQGFVRILDEFYYKTFAGVVADFKKAQHDFEVQVVGVAERFYLQYAQLLAQTADYAADTTLQERLKKGADYFNQQLQPLWQLLLNTPLSTNNKETAKRTKKVREDLFESLRLKTALLRHVAAQGFELKAFQQARINVLLGDGKDSSSASGKKKAEKTPKEKKIPTGELTLQLYKAGKRIEDIARERNLTTGTIFSHLAQQVEAGRLPLYDLVPPQQIARITAFYTQNPSPSTLTEARKAIGEDVEFAAIRLVHDMMVAESEEER